MLLKYTILAMLLVGCAGCETKPVNSPGGAGAGGGLLVVDSCDAACANFARMGCPQAETTDGVTCSDLCRQVPILIQTAPCAARAASCNEADNCSSVPDGSGGSGG